MANAHIKPETRFWNNIIKTDTCWLWQGSLGNRYGALSVNNKKVLAHRFSYELHVGPIPVGLELDHLCRVPACVNPEHLEAVTHRSNVLRGESGSALAARQTHCMNGHELTPENCYEPTKENPRRCIACNRARAAPEAVRKELVTA